MDESLLLATNCGGHDPKRSRQGTSDRKFALSLASVVARLPTRYRQIGVVDDID